MSKAHSGITLCILTAKNSPSLYILTSNVHSIFVFCNVVPDTLYWMWSSFSIDHTAREMGPILTNGCMKQVASIKPLSLSPSVLGAWCAPSHLFVLSYDIQGGFGEDVWKGYVRRKALLKANLSFCWYGCTLFVRFSVSITCFSFLRYMYWHMRRCCVSSWL